MKIRIISRHAGACMLVVVEIVKKYDCVKMCIIDPPKYEKK